MWWKNHLLISIITGVIYFIFTKNLIYSFLLFSAGFFVDVDHYLLYLVIERKSFKDTYRMFRGISRKDIPDSDAGKYILFFHNFEFVIILIALGVIYPVLSPVALGVLIHFVIDILYVRNFKLKHYYSALYFVISKLR